MVPASRSGRATPSQSKASKAPSIPDSRPQLHEPSTITPSRSSRQAAPLTASASAGAASASQVRVGASHGRHQRALVGGGPRFQPGRSVARFQPDQRCGGEQLPLRRTQAERHRPHRAGVAVQAGVQLAVEHQRAADEGIDENARQRGKGQVSRLPEKGET